VNGSKRASTMSLRVLTSSEAKRILSTSESEIEANEDIQIRSSPVSEDHIWTMYLESCWWTVSEFAGLAGFVGGEYGCVGSQGGFVVWHENFRLL
jgi:hypothetical protein